MTAHIAKIMESASSIAIQSATSQKVSATIIPFQHRDQKREAEATAPAEEPKGAVVAQNDNFPALPARPEFGASALIARPALARAVEIATHVVERRNSVPILSNLAIVGCGDAIRVTGTDLDVEIVVTVPAAADQTFGTTLPAHVMKDLLKKATASDFVAITTAEDRDSLDFERVQYHLAPLSIADFPHLSPPAGDAHTFTLPGRAFSDGIASTMDAVSTEESRYYLNGIFLHVADTEFGPRLRMVATDGHRLYRQDMDMPIGAAGMAGVIVPRKTVNLMHRLMRGKACPDNVKVAVTGSMISVSFDDVVITSKTIDGTFPDYERVIPSYNDKIAMLEAEAALEAIRAVTLISNERSRACKFAFGDGICTLIVNNPDQGSATANVSCDFEGDALEIGFNAGYASKPTFWEAGTASYPIFSFTTCRVQGSVSRCAL